MFENKTVIFLRSSVISKSHFNLTSNNFRRHVRLVQLLTNVKSRWTGAKRVSTDFFYLRDLVWFLELINFLATPCWDSEHVYLLSDFLCRHLNKHALGNLNIERRRGWFSSPCRKRNFKLIWFYSGGLWLCLRLNLF